MMNISLIDRLLCHDDELEGRRIAFIYYLVPPSWSKEDGGEFKFMILSFKYSKFQ